MNGNTHFFIRAFYQAIESGEPAPICEREITLVARIMDEIFSQLAASRTEATQPEAPAPA
jgi:hypothetical protein